MSSSAVFNFLGNLWIDVSHCFFQPVDGDFTVNGPLSFFVGLACLEPKPEGEALMYLHTNEF